jgi:hypothetical protein
VNMVADPRGPTTAAMHAERIAAAAEAEAAQAVAAQVAWGGGGGSARGAGVPAAPAPAPAPLAVTAAPAALAGAALLGADAAAAVAAEDALAALVDVHRSDAQMYYEFVSLTAMPSWVLTEVRPPRMHECHACVLCRRQACTSHACALVQVQHTRLMAAHIELGMPMVDMLRLFQAAAQEQRWEALFASWTAA